MHDRRPDHKWLIDRPASITAAERQRYWEDLHVAGSAALLSITDDPREQQRILAALGGSNPRRLLLPGCGASGALERCFMGALPDALITAVDYPRVVDLARAACSHENVTYVARDIAALGYDRVFDAVILVNAAVSESDIENRSILAGCARALVPGGRFVGYFPTIFSPLDIALLSNDARRIGNIDLAASTYYEASQGQHQIFYTPLRLRMILREAGMSIESMEVVFLDAERYGGDQPWRDPTPPDDDFVIYEHFVVARAAG